MKKTSDPVVKGKEFIKSLEDRRNNLISDKEGLLVEIEEIESEIKAIDQAIIYNSELIGTPYKSPQFNQDQTSRKLPDNFDYYKGTDFFLYGFKKLGKKEATVSEITAEVEKIDADVIIDRRQKGTLKQWMTVSGDTLTKQGIIVKNKNDDDKRNMLNQRKGGVTFKLL